MELFRLKAAFPFQHINVAYLVLCCIAAVTACHSKKEVLPFYNTPDFTAEWITPGDTRFNKIHVIDTFTLHNQLGHLITKDSFDGYIYVANFFFTTCPGICPKMTSNLQSLQNTFADNKRIKLVSFSVMPWIDTVDRLKEYGENHLINPNKWYLLTGNKERIYNLGRQSYFSERRLGLQKDSSDFLHTESMLLIDKSARIRGIYNATEKKDIDRVVKNIETLLNE
jgi:protein SCO1/2